MGGERGTRSKGQENSQKSELTKRLREKRVSKKGLVNTCQVLLGSTYIEIGLWPLDLTFRKSLETLKEESIFSNVRGLKNESDVWKLRKLSANYLFKKFGSKGKERL